MHDKKRTNYIYQNDVITYNEKKERHGNWIKHLADGSLNFKESYINGRAYGYSKQFYYIKSKTPHRIIETYVAR